MIRKIVELTGAKIDIEDDGKVFVAAVDAEAGQKAVDLIQNLSEIQKSDRYTTERSRG